MIGHKICVYGEIWIIIPKLSLVPLLVCSATVPKDNYTYLSLASRNAFANGLCLIFNAVIWNIYKRKL